MGLGVTAECSLRLFVNQYYYDVNDLMLFLVFWLYCVVCVWLTSSAVLLCCLCDIEAACFCVKWPIYSLWSCASDEYWIYSTGQKTVFTRSAVTPSKVNRFGWYLEHSWVHCWGLALADFGRNLRSSDSLGASQHWSDKQRNFHEIWTQNVDRCRNENFQNRILKILP